MRRPVPAFVLCLCPLYTQPWQPVPKAQVTVHRLDRRGCGNMPENWKRQATRITDANGRFSYQLAQPPSIKQEYRAAGFTGPVDWFLASREIVQPGLGTD